MLNNSNKNYNVGNQNNYESTDSFDRLKEIKGEINYNNSTSEVDFDESLDNILDENKNSEDNNDKLKKNEKDVFEDDDIYTNVEEPNKKGLGIVVRGIFYIIGAILFMLLSYMIVDWGKKEITYYHLRNAYTNIQKQEENLRSINQKYLSSLHKVVNNVEKEKINILNKMSGKILTKRQKEALVDILNKENRILLEVLKSPVQVNGEIGKIRDTLNNIRISNIALMEKINNNETIVVLKDTKNNKIGATTEKTIGSEGQEKKDKSVENSDITKIIK